MAESYVQVPPDSTGKKLRSFQQTIGANVVEHQGFVICDSAGNVVETIAAGAIPTGQERSLAVKQPGLTQQYGSLRVTPEPSSLFFDPLESLDTNRWTTAGTAPTFSSGVAAINPGVVTLATSQLVSVPTFLQEGSVWLQVAWAISAAAVATNQPYRFWGLGTAPGSPTIASPLTDAIGWEYDSSGLFYAVVYANGVNVFRTAIGNTMQTYHRYVVQIRSDRMYWFIDDMNVPVATASFITPNVQALPLRAQVVNPASAPNATGTLSAQSVAVTDLGHNSMHISDGTYHWRKAQVSANGALTVAGQATGTSAVTNVASSATNVTLKAANTNRKGLFIFNAGTANLFVKLGATATTTTSFTVMIAPNGYFELPDDPIYTGIVDGIWSATGGNGANVTEIT